MPESTADSLGSRLAALHAERERTWEPVAWHGDAGLAETDVVPLAVLEKPCRFREAAIGSLEAAGRRYRLAVETPNLSTLRAAVEAGLGLTCRTPLFMGEKSPLDGMLPALPNVASLIVRAPRLEGAAARLADLAADAIVDA